MSAATRTNQLLEAAEACFGRAGYQLTSIDSIAKEAGLSKGSVYRFFKSKDDILLALLDKYDREINLEAEAELDKAGDPREQIRVFAKAVLIYLSSRNDMERVWAEFLLQPKASEIYLTKLNAFRLKLESIIEEAMTSGLFRQQDPRVIADLLITVTEGLLSLSVIETKKNTIDKFDEFWPLLLKSLQ